MNKELLKAHTLSQSLFNPTSLSNAISKLGFIQADPIRSPARAQDLILRHRVIDYNVDDLEKLYPSLELEEDYLYAYGFVTKELRKVLYPRTLSNLTDFDLKVLEIVKGVNEVHPKDLEKEFGSVKVKNGWGGSSKATTRSLDKLHYNGFVRILRRDKGIRVYKYIKEESLPESLETRKEKIVLAVLNLLAPIPLKTLNQSLYMTRYFVGETKSTIQNLLKKEVLKEETIDGIKYIFPAKLNEHAKELTGVKFLAPFDPIVWDRIRFEHIWDWAYRFEAYTPKTKRIRGYYALPLLWGYDVIGWANISNLKNDFKVEIGFVNSKPNSPIFDRELEKEISNMKSFLRI